MSKARPLKKRLAALEASIPQCSDPIERARLQEEARRLRSDLERAGYIEPLVKLPKLKKRKPPKKQSKPQNVDPLVRAQTRVGSTGGLIKFVQGGAARGK